MITLLIVFLVIVCVLLIAVVLMQASKGGGLTSTFGGSNVTSMFGARRTSDFLSKSTIVLATVFLLVSLLMNLYISKTTDTSESVLQKNSGSAPGQQTIPQQNIPSPDAPPTQQPDQQQNQNP